MKHFRHIEHEFPKLERITSADGTRVYQTPNGGAYPSVTTVTGLLKKEAIMAWRKRVGEKVANEISSKAARRGTRIHNLCEDYLNNQQIEIDMFDQSMWQSFTPLLDRIDNIHCLEQPLFSHHLKVAGTVDCIAEFDGKLSVIDFKTSKRKKSVDEISDYFMQCSAYAVAFEELTNIPISRLVILMAVDDEDPLLFIQRRDDYVDSFISLREDYRKWKNI